MNGFKHIEMQTGITYHLNRLYKWFQFPRSTTQEILPEPLKRLSRAIPLARPGSAHTNGVFEHLDQLPHRQIDRRPNESHHQGCWELARVLYYWYATQI